MVSLDATGYFFATPDATKPRNFFAAPLFNSAILCFDCETRGLFQGHTVVGSAKEVLETGEILNYLAVDGRLPEDLVLSPQIKILTLTEFFEMIFSYPGIVIGANPLFDLGRGSNSVDVTDITAKAKPTLKRGANEIRASQRGSGVKISKYRTANDKRNYNGSVIDVLTLGTVLTGRLKMSLRALGKTLGTKHQKTDMDYDKVAIDQRTIDYLLNDVEVTYEAYIKLKAILDPQDKGLLSKFTSSASLGKQMLQDMGIVKPTHQQRPYCFEAYYGGRAEVNFIGWNGTLWTYLDFFSQYPSLQINLGLLRFLLTNEVICVDATKKWAQKLDEIGIEELKQPELWKKLSGMLIQITCEDFRLPVRRDISDGQINVSLPFVTLTEPTWYSVFDYLAGKLYKNELGKGTVTIHKIVEYQAVETQTDLHEVSVFGKTVHPKSIFEDLLQYRAELKKELRETDKTDLKALELTNKVYGVKIILNATSYGSTIERNETMISTLRELETPNGLLAFGVSLKEGPFCVPIIGVQITSGARLEAAIAEVINHRYTKNMLPYLDTDGFLCCEDAASEIIAYFNPFSIIEGEEFLKRELDEQIEFFGIAPKRYLLFQRDAKGLPKLERPYYKEHGLGTFLFPDIEKRNGKEVVLEETLRQKVIKGYVPSQEIKEYLKGYALSAVNTSTNKAMREHMEFKPYSFGWKLIGTEIFSADKEATKLFRAFGDSFAQLLEIDNDEWLTRQMVISRWFEYRNEKYTLPNSEIGWVTAPNVKIIAKKFITKLSKPGIEITDEARIGMEIEKRERRTEQKEDKALIINAHQFKGLITKLFNTKELGRDYLKRGMLENERSAIKAEIERRW